MNILIDARTTQDEIKFNGVGRYSRFIIQYLISNFPKTNYILLMYEAPSTLDKFLSKRHTNVRIHRIGKLDDQGAMKMIRHNLDIVFHIRLNKAIKELKGKVDVFLSPYFWKGLPVSKIPVVAVFHDFALVKYRIYSTISPIHNLFRAVHYWMELLRLYSCEAIICDSDNTRRDVLKYLPRIKREFLHTVYLGIEEDRGETDIKKYLPKDYESKEYLIYLGGGLTKNKNSRGVIDGYKYFVDMLKKEGGKTVPYLVISGKNFSKEFSKEANNFHEYVDSLGLKESVWFTGFYDDTARWPLMHNAFAYIHLSLYEGFGFSVAEAMREKVPVIAHKGSTYVELIKDGGILVNGEDAKEIGEAIYRLYKDREYGKKLAQIGYEESLRFNWQKTASQTHDILSKVFEKK